MNAHLSASHAPPGLRAVARSARAGPNRHVFIALASIWQIAAFQVRPTIVDKATYVLMAEAIPASDSWYLLYKEPLFALASKVAFEAGQIVSISFDNGVGLVNIVASILVAMGLAGLTKGSNRDFLLLLPLFFLYDFIYLSAETVRAHLGTGFFLLYLAARQCGRRSFGIGIAAALTHFSLFLPFLVLEYFGANRAVKSVILVLGLGATVIAASAIGFDDLSLMLDLVAGATNETARRFPEVRAYVLPVLALMLVSSLRSGANAEIRIVACVFTIMTPALYLMGATEIALRAFSTAMVFITLLFALYRGRLTTAAHFTMQMAAVLLYTSASPLSLLYGI